MGRLLVRSLFGVGLALAAGVAVVGGLALSASGMVALALAGVVAGCLGAGVVRESATPGSRSAVEVAGQAAACTVGALLLLSGAAALAGGAGATTLVAVAAVGGLIRWRARMPRSRAGWGRTARTAGVAGSAPEQPSGAVRHPSHPAGAWAASRDGGTAALPRFAPPVGTLGTEALGLEWLRTTAALTGPLDPAVRQAIVQRRRETLDELERRDPDGFARWLADGPLPASDPARYVEGDPAAGTDAA